MKADADRRTCETDEFGRVWGERPREWRMMRLVTMTMMNCREENKVVDHEESDRNEGGEMNQDKNGNDW